MDRYRVTDGKGFRLADHDPRDGAGFAGTRAEAEAELTALQDRIGELQDLLYADGRHRVLVVLQAMDTGGKDGTIRNVFRHVDPIGIRAVSFKAPSAHERAHDYLWRIHQHVPADGELVVFNRSHYEDVLVVRVHGWIDEAQVAKRHRHIRHFERMLAEEGTTIVKVFLHLSKDEQRQRLIARRDTPEKRWKFNQGDLDERVHWDAYQEAYQDAIAATASAHAPWHVVPADRKWYRNLVVARIVADALDSAGLAYPDAAPGVEDAVID